jgi:radical SAM superfamily enzyme YgiQ (UPF0313 family)
VATEFIKQGKKVDLLDMSDQTNLTIPFTYDYYGIICITPNMPIIKKICDMIRKNTQAKILLGGPHVTVTYSANSKRSQKDREAIESISDFQHEGAITEDLTIPDRNLIDLNDYHYEIDGKKATSIIAQNGCPYNCGFCSGRNTHYYRSAKRKSIELLMSEVDNLYEMGYRGLNYYDDEINLNKKEFHALLNEFIKRKKRGMKWALRGFSRADLLTQEEANLMYEAGFRWLLVGFESGSDRMLVSMNKKVTVAQNTKAIEIAHKAGMKVKALMSIGHPGENSTTINETISWMKNVKIDDFDITVVSIYPGTPYYERAEKKDDIWTYTSPTGDKLYSNDIDFMTEESNYKGRPGEYNCHVWTDYLSKKELLSYRDSIEARFKVPGKAIND